MRSRNTQSTRKRRFGIPWGGRTSAPIISRVCKPQPPCFGAHHWLVPGGTHQSLPPMVTDNGIS